MAKWEKLFDNTDIIEAPQKEPFVGFDFEEPSILISYKFIPESKEEEALRIEGIYILRTDDSITLHLKYITPFAANNDQIFKDCFPLELYSRGTNYDSDPEEDTQIKPCDQLAPTKLNPTLTSNFVCAENKKQLFTAVDTLISHNRAPSELKNILEYFFLSKTEKAIVVLTERLGKLERQVSELTKQLAEAKQIPQAEKNNSAFFTK